MLLEQKFSWLAIVGPGVVAYGVTGLISDMWEFRKKKVNVNYTENLLVQPAWDVETDSPALSYLLTVAPGKRYFPLNERMYDYLIEYGITPVDSPSGVRLVNKIEDLRDGGFFAPLGKVVTSVVPIVNIITEEPLPYRMLMRTPVSEEVREILRQTAVTYFFARDGYAYFFFDKEERKSFPYAYTTRATMRKGNLSFSDVQLRGPWVMKENSRLIVFDCERQYHWGLTSQGFINVDKLEDIKNVTPELTRNLLQYIPLADRQMAGGYVRRDQGWAAFKKKIRQQLAEGSVPPVVAGKKKR
jgi:hypothetical protein